MTYTQFVYAMPPNNEKSTCIIQYKRQIALTAGSEPGAYAWH